MKHTKFYSLIVLSLLIAACSSQQTKAPVIDRSAALTDTKASKIKTTQSAPQKSNAKDWRPDTYTVKKGDTLYSIGLDFGYDYKEIAQNNNIDAPYVIRVGQQLNIKSKNTASAKPAEANNDDVVIKPLNTDSQMTPGQNSISSPSNIPTLNSPKASREPYSDQAYNAAKAPETKPAELKPIDPKSGELKPSEVKPSSAAAADDVMDWGLPTKGKVNNGFNEGASAKGIDIEGTMGQDINAVGNGKVIYNGSDLRGYGNLVIVKHNKDYLSVYAHNSKILVKEGQAITKGQKIAEMGNSGTNIVKLHFEIRYQGKSIDPTKLLSGL